MSRMIPRAIRQGAHHGAILGRNWGKSELELGNQRCLLQIPQQLGEIAMADLCLFFQILWTILGFQQPSATGWDGLGSLAFIHLFPPTLGSEAQQYLPPSICFEKILFTGQKHLIFPLQYIVP